MLQCGLGDMGEKYHVILVNHVYSMIIPAQGNKHGISDVFNHVEGPFMKLIDMGNPLKSVD